MFSFSHASKSGRSVRLAALLAMAVSASGRWSWADEDVSSLVDAGLNQIVADEVAQRMSKFLEGYEITGLASVSIDGTFRSLSSDDLKQQMTRSLDRHGIAVDGTSSIKLDGELLFTETQEAVVIVMLCSLNDPNEGELCTVRVRKVLPAGSGS